jgi:hypothetical protein
MARQKHIGVRLSDEEFLRLAAVAALASMSPAAWLRYMALRSFAATPPPVAPPPAAPSPPAALSRTTGTRFTSEQHDSIAERAEACGLPVAAYVRQLVLGAAPSDRRPDVRAAVVALNRVGNNLNQLTKLAHAGTLLPRDLQLAVEHLLAEVRRLRDALLGTGK